MENRGNLKGGSFRQADAQLLAFEDATFDTVVCQFGIMFFPDQAKGSCRIPRCAETWRHACVYRMGFA